MTWKANLIVLFALSITSLLLSFFNIILSAIILYTFYIIDLINPPYYSYEEMEKTIVFISPLLVIFVTLYDIILLFIHNYVIYVIILIIMFSIDVYLSSNRVRR